MNPDLQETLIQIRERLVAIEVRLVSGDVGAADLEARVRVLEAFRSRVLGAIVVAGTLGGIVGAFTSLLLSLIGFS